MFRMALLELTLTTREETMFDLLFIGNPAIDKAIAEPEDMPQSLIARLRGATLKTLEKHTALQLNRRHKGLFSVDQSWTPLE